MTEGRPSVWVRAAAPGEIARCHAIRREVFVEEQGVPLEEEMDDRDATSTHFLAFIGDDVIGTARVRTTEKGALKAERVAVRMPFRRHGAGRALMAAIEDAARGHDELVLNAQMGSVPFYERLGYRTEGPVFLEAGIPHRAMRKRLG